VTLTDGALNELIFWKGLPRTRFEGDIWPPTAGISIRMASDASDFGWGGHTMEDAPQYAREYFTAEESSQSSTYRELLGVFRCLQAMIHLCEGKFVVFQVDAQNLLGVVNRGSPRLMLNELARDPFWFCLESRMTITVEWVPREENALADELSKLIVPDDWMLRRELYQQLEERWGPHLVDLFASGGNNQCERFYSLHWCRGSAGVNAFASHWGCGPVWINCPYRLLGRVWRKLRGDGTVATVLVPLWRSSTWWGLLAPDGVHFSEEVVDWVWLPRGEHSLFVPGSGPGGKDVVPPDWPVMAVRVDFSPGGDLRRIPLHERCVQGGCDACRSHAWHR
jgi:hypothetical protein